MRFDALIIGSGLAGLSLAIKLADHMKVGLITKRSLLDGASGNAQGGIAAVMSPDDSVSSHIADTLTAGAGLCDETTTRLVVENGKAVQRAVEAGLREKGLVEVQGEGITEGMQVVTEGAYGLPPETKVRIISE